MRVRAGAAGLFGVGDNTAELEAPALRWKRLGWSVMQVRWLLDWVFNFLVLAGFGSVVMVMVKVRWCHGCELSWAK
jgi:hypothetical protein